MKTVEGSLKSFLCRVSAALETPGDLTAEEKKHLIDDLGEEIRAIELREHRINRIIEVTLAGNGLGEGIEEQYGHVLRYGFQGYENMTDEEIETEYNSIVPEAEEDHWFLFDGNNKKVSEALTKAEAERRLKIKMAYYIDKE